jgi:hypothetical protein
LFGSEKKNIWSYDLFVFFSSGRDKLSLTEGDVTIVLEKDGSQIDEWEVAECLAGEVLLFLKEGEVWIDPSQKTVPSQTSEATDEIFSISTSPESAMSETATENPPTIQKNVAIVTPSKHSGTYIYI